jgi:serine/threonine-protein kinase
MAGSGDDGEAARFRAAERIFAAASELPAGARAAFVARECAGDERLERDVGALLAASATAAELFARPPDPRIGEAVGRWRVMERIGAGGMGVVYRAERDDGEFAQTVAVKFLRAALADDEARGRFLRERQVLARLSHPAIARLIDGGTAGDGSPYLVMEMVDGVHLGEWCDARRLPVAARLELFRAICAAVEFAHRRLVVHRDLKPSNVLVTPDGQVKLLDFGIAKVLEPGAASERSLTVERRFTPEYASPEVVRGELATTAADVYSLGAILYELLTGGRPHEAPTRTPAALERAICETVPPPPAAAPITAEAAAARGTTPDQLRARLRGDLDAIAAVALEKEPDRRYPSVEQLSEDVRRFLAGEPVAARRPGRGEVLVRWVKRNRALAATGAAALLLLVGGGAATTGLWLEARRQARASEHQTAVTARVNQLMKSLLQSISSGPAAARDESLPTQLESVGRSLDGGLLREDPGIESELRSMLGSTWSAIGRAPESAAQYARAAELARAAFGADARTTLRMEVLHAHAVAAAGDLRLGLEQMAGVVARCERAAPGSAELALAFELLGDDLVDDERPAEAVAPLRRCLERREQAPAPSRFGIASALNALGIALAASGAPAEAEPLLRRSLEMRREEKTAWRVAVALDALGDALTRLARYDEAERTLGEAFDLRRDNLDRDHPDRAATLGHLGALHRETGRLADAETELREALRIVRARLPERHPRIARAELELADLLALRGRHDEAKGLAVEAERVARAAGCDDAHPLVKRARAIAESSR